MNSYNLHVFCRRIEDIYKESFICRIDDNNPSYLIPLNDSSVKLFCVSPYFRMKPNKVFKYQRKEKADSGTHVYIAKVQKTLVCHRKLFISGNIYNIKFWPNGV